MNTGVCKCFWIGDSGFLGYNSSIGMLGQKTVPCLVFWRNSILFTTVAAPLCIPNSALGYPFLHILTAFVVCWFINDSYFDTCLFFSFISLALGDILAKILLHGISKIFLPVASSKIFMVSQLIFKSFIHFEFILVYCVRWWSSFIFCMYQSSSPNTIYWKGHCGKQYGICLLYTSDAADERK